MSQLLIAESINAAITIIANLIRANNLEEEKVMDKLKDAIAEAKKRDPKDLPPIPEEQ